MGNWVKMQVELIGKVVSGATPATMRSDFWNGEIKWITPTDLSKINTPFAQKSERTISELGLQSCSAQLIPAGNLVLSSRAPIGYFAIVQSDFTTNQGCKSIIFDKKQNPLFHYYNFLFWVDKFKEKGEGTTFAEISKKEIEKLAFHFPESYEEQSTIATVLNTIDQTIEKTEQLIAKYECIKTGLMQDLLTRGIDEQGNIRSEETHEFKDSPLGRVPKEWGVEKLGNLCDIKGRIGWQGYTVDDLDSEGALVLGATHISKKHELDLSKPVYLKWEKYWEAPEIYVKKGNIILVKTGNTIGKTALINEEIGHATINPNTIILRNFRIDSRYLYLLMTTNYFQTAIWDFVLIGAQPSVNQANIKSIDIPCPPQCEITKTIMLWEELYETIAIERQNLKNIQSLKTGMMQDLLTGKVSVDALMKN